MNDALRRKIENLVGDDKKFETWEDLLEEIEWTFPDRTRIKFPGISPYELRNYVLSRISS